MRSGHRLRPLLWDQSNSLTDSERRPIACVRFPISFLEAVRLGLTPSHPASSTDPLPHSPSLFQLSTDAPNDLIPFPSSLFIPIQFPPVKDFRDLLFSFPFLSIALLQFACCRMENKGGGGLTLEPKPFRAIKRRQSMDSGGGFEFPFSLACREAAPSPRDDQKSAAVIGEVDFFSSEKKARISPPAGIPLDLMIKKEDLTINVIRSIIFILAYHSFFYYFFHILTLPLFNWLTDWFTPRQRRKRPVDVG